MIYEIFFLNGGRWCAINLLCVNMFTIKTPDTRNKFAICLQGTKDIKKNPDFEWPNKFVISGVYCI
jgi:hypothetical protein